MTGHDKVLAEHRERRAFVYVRQSTPAQVLQHQTSTERQLQLTHVASSLGWDSSQIEVVAEDLGRSGRFAEGRDGFQRLAAEVSLGRVGAVLSLDASRLARSSADWHRLLELSALTRTLLIDEQTVYDPRDPNDRLVLGMKGTMADFELVWLRQRLEGGRWHLAEKGEFRGRPPIGYVYDADGRLGLDPDEEIRRSVALLFERYRAATSRRDVLRYFEEHALPFPCRFGSRVEWKRLTLRRVDEMLRNPAYAGAYVYGRTRSELILEEGRRRRRVRTLPQQEWRVVLHGRHPTYLSWEEYMANRKRLADSSPARKDRVSRGAPREGSALLQGLLLCGRCAHRLSVRYAGQNGRYPAYYCDRVAQEGLGERCVCVSARYLDEPVVELVLGILTREQLDAATKVLDIVETEDAALHQQWKLRLERARYEAQRVERQYQACEPENRVVARTLETRWNEKLADLERLEREYVELKARKRAELTDGDRSRIVELADDVPRLWHAPTTTDRDRKALLRLLVQDIAVSRTDVPRFALRVRILWHTQAVTEIEIEYLGPGRFRRKPTWRTVGVTGHHPPKRAC
jgi:DNA invertase Pin-like site-specific DNA recombinase